MLSADRLTPHTLCCLAYSACSSLTGLHRILSAAWVYSACSSLPGLLCMLFSDRIYTACSLLSGLLCMLFADQIYYACSLLTGLHRILSAAWLTLYIPAPEVPVHTFQRYYILIMLLCSLFMIYLNFRKLCQALYAYFPSLQPHIFETKWEFPQRYPCLPACSDFLPDRFPQNQSCSW